MPTCTAHRSSGGPCRAPAIKGGNVCVTHGGRAPQVVAAAKLKLLAMVDPALAALLRETKRKTNAPNGVAVAAARDILDRAGLAAAPPESASAGTVINLVVMASGQAIEAPRETRSIEASVVES